MPKQVVLLIAATGLGVGLARLTGAAASIRNPREAEFLLIAGLPALAGMALYAMIQRIDADPFTWATPGVVFSTLGNTNDLAENCVLAVAPAGLLLSRPWRSREWMLGLGAAAVAGELVLWSHSRSGFIGLLIALARHERARPLRRRPPARGRPPLAPDDSGAACCRDPIGRRERRPQRARISIRAGGFVRRRSHGYVQHSHRPLAR